MVCFPIALVLSIDLFTRLPNAYLLLSLAIFPLLCVALMIYAKAPKIRSGSYCAFGVGEQKGLRQVSYYGSYVALATTVLAVIAQTLKTMS